MITSIRSIVRQVRRIASATHAPHSAAHIAQQAGWAWVYEASGLVVRYGLVLLIARITGPSGLGRYVLAMGFGFAAAMVGRVGMNQAVLRFIPYHRARGELGQAVGVSVFSTVVAGIGGAGVAVALFLVAPHLEEWWGVPGLGNACRIIALAVPLMALGEVWVSGLRGFQDVRLAMFLQRVAVPLVTAIGLLWILLIRPDDPLAAVIGAAIAFWLVGLASATALGRKLRSVRARPIYRTRTWISFALPMSLEGGLLFLVFSTDVMMLGWFLDADDVGVYYAAVRLAALVALPLLAVNTIFAPTIASLHGGGDHATLQQLYARITWGTVLLGGSIALALWAGGYWVLRAFGPAFVAGYAAFAILVAGQAVNAGTGSSGLVLGMTGRAGWRLINAASTAGLNVGLNWLLIPPWGITGAAVATAVSLGLINLVQVLEVRWLLGFWAYDSRGLAYWRALVFRRAPPR